MLIHCGTQVISSNRLTLRPFEHTDNNHMLDNWVSDSNIQSMISEPVYTTKEETKELLDKYINSDLLR